MKYKYNKLLLDEKKQIIIKDNFLSTYLLLCTAGNNTNP